MAGRVGIGCCCYWAGRVACFLLLWICLWGTGGGVAEAQDVSVPAKDEPIHTLHVYTNLVQVPTLVLTMNQDRVDKPIAESRFSVSIDSGRWFRATHVRQEGDDPISLSVLLDVSGDAANLMPKMGEALGELAPLSLHALDRVSVYALDCSLRRALYNWPADKVSLEKAVGAALEPWMLRKRTKQTETCENGGRLWDGLATVAITLSDLPGRRAILVVTDGQDRGSRNSWSELREFAQRQGIAIFALNVVPRPLVGMGSYRGGRGGYLPGIGGASGVEDPLNSVCQLSGGLVMRMKEATALQATLEQFVRTLRERYIVEFPRPSNSTAGEHGMEVKIEKGAYFIRPSGVSIPMPDPVLMADPTTIQTGPSQAPEEGKRKVLNKPQ
jgi:hypothetical protein